MRREDATPSWSGYIFQGEVALCMALETIIELGADNILDNYCLKLEEDEDFSIKTKEIKVFQVKAYLGNNSNKLNTYKDVIEELINKYYYSIIKKQDKNDKRRMIISSVLNPRKRPIKTILITSSVIDDIDNQLSTFHRRFNSINFNYFQIIHGEYKIENISLKINEAIKILLPDLHEDDIEVKRCYCCSEINKKIYDRHKTKQLIPISFNTIMSWLLESPNAFTEEICWYEINKIFFQSLHNDLALYDLSNEEECKICNKIDKSLKKIFSLSSDELVNLIDSYLIPHKILDKRELRASYGNYIDQEVVKQVILEALKKIEQEPIYEKLQYKKKNAKEVLCYQLLIHNNRYGDDRISKVKFQKHCEDIYNQPITKDIDYFVTSNLDSEKEDVKNRLIEILETDKEFNKSNESSYENELLSKTFGFRRIDNAIQEINSI